MIYRTYACDSCDTVFEVCHDSSDEPYPDCPTCSKVLEWRPKSFNMTGVKSKAIDLAQNIMENDYGLSNFKDNNREGDIGIIRPQETASEKDKIEREVREMVAQTTPAQTQTFWGGNAGAPTPVTSMNARSMIAMAKQGAQGPDPMALLHAGAKKGTIPTTNQMATMYATKDRL